MQKNKVQKRNITKNSNSIIDGFISKVIFFFFDRLQVFLCYALYFLIILIVPIIVFLLIVASSSYQEKVTYVLYIISSWLVAIFIQSKVFNQPKKSFSNIYFEVLKNKQTNNSVQPKPQNNKKIVKIMDSVQEYLIKYSDEEILLHNLYFTGKKINLHNPTLAALIAGCFIIMARIDINNNFLYELLSIGLFFLPVIIMYLIVFIIRTLTYSISKRSCLEKFVNP